MKKAVNKVSLAFKVVGALISFWVGNVGCQYFAATFGAWKSLETMSSPNLGEFLISLAQTQPLCLSFERMPLVIGALVAFFSVMFSSMKNYRYDNEVPFDHQYDTAAMATPEQAMELAHTSEEFTYKKKTVKWEKPEHLEELLDDNIMLSTGCMFGASRIPRIPNFYSKHSNAVDKSFDPEGIVKNRHGWVLATSGSGKTYRWLTSNALNLPGSMLFLDPKGELFERFSAFFEAHGIKVFVLDLRDEYHMRYSCHYNPLSYIDVTPIYEGMDWHDFHINYTRSDAVIKMFIESTRGKKTAGDQQYFIDQETNLYKALVPAMLILFAAAGQPENCTIPEMLTWLQLVGGSVDAGDPEGLDDLDRFFYGTWEENHVHGLKGFIIKAFGQEAWDEPGIKPWTYCFDAYEGFKSCRLAEETKAGVVSSCFARLQRFLNPTIRDLVSDDEFDFDNFGKEKRAIFCCIPSGDEDSGPYGFLVSLFLNQLFDKQVEVAQSTTKNTLDIPEWFFLDEVANLPKIPKLPELFATGRSYGINLTAIIQSESLMEERYGKAGTAQIRANTAYQVYLGFRDKEDAKKLSESMGFRTEVTRSWNKSTSSTGTSVNEQVHANKVPWYTTEELLTFNDNLPNGRQGLHFNDCIVKVGTQPYFVGEKLNPQMHRRWKELEQYGLTSIEDWQTKRRARLKLRMLPEHAESLKIITINPEDKGTYYVESGSIEGN